MELIISVALITAVVMIADVSFAIQGNWPRIVRFTLTAAGYVGVLGSTLRVLGRFGAPPARLPLWVFLASGVAGGVIGTLGGTSAPGAVAVASAVLTPAVLGTFHWVALQRWAWIRQLASRPSSKGGQGS